MPVYLKRVERFLTSFGMTIEKKYEKEHADIDWYFGSVSPY